MPRKYSSSRTKADNLEHIQAVDTPPLDIHLWRSGLKGDPIAWLLEENHPAIRWHTLRSLLDLRADDPAVLWTRANIPDDPMVKPILAAQHPAGYWNRPGVGLLPFYRGTVWALFLLSELGLSPEHQVAQIGCQHLLSTAFQQTGEIIPFRLFGRGVLVPFPRLRLSALVLLPLLRFGFGLAPIVQQGLIRLAEDVLATGCRCLGRRNQPCGWAAVKALKVFAEAPERGGRISQATNLLADLLLGTPYWEASHFAARDPDWARFAFPLFHQTDLLELAEAAVALGQVHHPDLAEIVALVEGKQAGDGRWRIDRSLAKDGWARLEEAGQPGKWVTLRALKVIKAVRSLV